MADIEPLFSRGIKQPGLLVQAQVLKTSRPCSRLLKSRVGSQKVPRVQNKIHRRI